MQNIPFILHLDTEEVSSKKVQGRDSYTVTERELFVCLSMK